MIAKIGKVGNLYGAISYNQLKVDRGLGEVLGLNKIPETINNTYSTNLLYHSFIPYLAANVKTEIPVRHISLNPDPNDKLTDVVIGKSESTTFGNLECSKNGNNGAAFLAI